MLLSPTALVVLVLGVATVIAAAVAERGVDRAEQAMLEDRLTDTATLAAAAYEGMVATVDDAARTAALADGEYGAWRAEVGTRLGGSALQQVALVNVQGSTPLMLTMAGRTKPVLLDESMLGALRAEPPEGQLAPLAVRPTAAGSISAYGRPVPGYPGLAVYGEIDVSALVSRDFAVFDDADGVLYDGGRPGGAVLAATTSDLPLHGRTAGRAVQLGGSTAFLVLSPNGSLVPGWAEAAPIVTLIAGLVITAGLAGVVEAARRRRRSAELLAEALEEHAARDELTGLSSRRELLARLDGVLNADGAPAVAIVDVSGFRALNDALGHAAGDRLLCEVGHRLLEAAGPGLACARLGGDQFAIVAPGGERQAVEVAARVRGSLAAPFRLGGRDARVGAAIGIAEGRREAGDASALVRDAELALLEHKHRSGSAWQTFSPALREQARERLALIDALPGAGARGELELLYQPVVRLSDQAVVGLEALVRWRRDGELISPAAFIPLAEETGAIVELGDAVLRLALGELAAARARFPQARVHVNVSARELEEGDYPDRLAALLRATNVAPASLVLELTESLTVGANAERLLHTLRGLGVGLAIDDFGAGYSNFATLERLPVEQVKVDRALLGGPAGVPRASFLRAAVEVIRSVGLVAVCEGVETEAHRALVRAAGFDAAQGYLYGRPAPLLDLARLAA